MTDTEPDIRTLPLPEALRRLREHGEPIDPGAARTIAVIADWIASQKLT